MNVETRSTLSFRVKGMTCGGCVRSVERILGNLRGVLGVNVRVGTVTVIIDPATVDAEAIGAALKEAGYAADLEPGSSQ